MLKYIGVLAIVYVSPRTLLYGKGGQFLIQIKYSKIDKKITSPFISSVVQSYFLQCLDSLQNWLGGWRWDNPHPPPKNRFYFQYSKGANMTDTCMDVFPSLWLVFVLKDWKLRDSNKCIRHVVICTSHFKRVVVGCCRPKWWNYTANEGPVRIQYKCLVPIYAFQNRITTFCLPISTLMHLRAIYIYPRMVCMLQPNRQTDLGTK